MRYVFSRTQPTPSPGRLADFPALAKVGVTEQELAALQRQGFVAREMRGNRFYYKLRYRLCGKQRVRYIRGAALAGAIRTELAMLQRNVRRRREMAALTRASSQQLSAAKATLVPTLEAMGFFFHGQSIRRRRGSTGGISPNTNPVNLETSCHVD
jgi:hypothetical protein